MKNKKNKHFYVSYNFITRKKRINSRRTYKSVEICCCGTGCVFVTYYTALYNGHKLVTHHIHEEIFKGGYKLATRLKQSFNQMKYDEIEKMTGVC